MLSIDPTRSTYKYGSRHPRVVKGVTHLAKPFLILLVLMASLISGCVTDALREEDEPPEQVQVPREMISALITPLVVNETADGKVTFRLHHRDWEHCLLDVQNLVVPYIQYDRAGFVASGAWHVDFSDKSYEDVDVVLEGEPPFVLAGNPDIFCVDQFKTQVMNVTSGALFQWNTTLQHSTVITVSIPAGEQRGSTTWHPHPYEWYLSQTWLPRSYDGEKNPQGEERGILTFRDPLGRLVREHSYHILTGRDIQNGIFARIEGDYSAVVELENPALTDTQWTYAIVTFRFDDRICAWGVEWVDLCEGYSKA